jgi:hypothetical protein
MADIELAPLLPKSSRDAVRDSDFSGSSTGEMGTSSTPCWTCERMLLLIKIIMISLVVGAVYYASQSKDISEMIDMKDPHKMVLSSASLGLYVRAAGSSLQMTEAIPWLQGSTLTVMEHKNSNCFEIRTSTGAYVVVDSKGKVYVDAAATGIQNGITRTFEMVVLHQKTSAKDETEVQLKVCEQDRFVEVQEDESGHVLVVRARHSEEGKVTSPSEALRSSGVSGGSRQAFASAAAAGGTDTVDSDVGGTTKSRRSLGASTSVRTGGSGAGGGGSGDEEARKMSVFRLYQPYQIRGVNLGGWFIPEIWMNPSFSNYTGLHWAGSLCK